MGEESIRFPEMLPTSSSKDKKRRARRYSSGSMMSRYLGPSPGSCHDFCKYGKKKKDEGRQLDIRSVILHGRMTMKLSSGHGSEEEAPSIVSSAAEARKKAGSSQQPKNTMQRVPGSSPGALKPKRTRTSPRSPSESHALPPKVKSIMTVGTRKSIAPSIHSAASPKARDKKKAAQSGGDIKEDVRGEESSSNDGKVENEASESTDCHSTRSFSEIQENGGSCKFSDFTESDEVDEPELNRSAEKVNSFQSLIHCPRRLKFRSHSDDYDERVDSGCLSDPGSMKVALRHWQLQEKNARRLLNDIIEETAVKLGRTQKSKVKALVGAFETVISLQDIDPSANIGK